MHPHKSEFNEQNKIQILGLPLDNLNYPELLNIIAHHINNHTKCTVAYANVHNLNVIQKQPDLYDTLQEFDIIHPDGIGVYLASKFFYGEKGFKARFVGSDFFEILNRKLAGNKWSIFFFGDEKETLNKITNANPGINIAGLQDGFTFDNARLIEQINRIKPDILLVGMGFPKQELWIAENKERVNCNVIIAAGGAIRVFSRTKVRGPVFFRKLGFEWFFRLFNNPKKLWKRYILGNPLFLYRIFKVKMINLFTR